MTANTANTANTAEALIARAGELVVVNDGAYRWVGLRREVYAWIDRAGLVRTGLHGGAREVEMDGDQYQAMCDSVACYVDTSGSYGPAGVDPYELIDQLEEQGSAYLYIR